MSTTISRSLTTPPTCLPEMPDVDQNLNNCLKLIEVCTFKAGHHLELIMDSDKNDAVALIFPGEAWD